MLNSYREQAHSYNLIEGGLEILWRSYNRGGFGGGFRQVVSVVVSEGREIGFVCRCKSATGRRGPN